MKPYKLITAAVLAALALGTSACDDGLADVNVNPNAPTDVEAQYLLPQAERSTVEQWYYSWFNTEFTGAFAQHWAKIQYTEEDQYRLRENSIVGWWNNLYSGDLKDWQMITEKGLALESPRGDNIAAVGMIGQVYTLHLITDIWGDVPWTQALKGDDPDEPITAPAYDSQESIYTAMLSMLDQAADMLDPSVPTFGAEDLYYGGDLAQWRKFANSLRLRLAMRMSDVAEATARPIVEELAAGGDLILTNADNATLVFLESVPYQNPLHENWKTRDDHAVSNTLVNLMGALNDPRIHVYANPAAVPDPTATFEWCDEAGEPVCHVEVDGIVYRGMRNGVNSGDVPEPIGLWSRLGDHYRANGATTPAILLSAAEVHFDLAEAALEGWAVGDAQTHYEAGVTAAFEMWDGANGVDLGSAAITAYLAQPGVAWGTTPADGAGDNFELVAEQNWLALYSTGPEAYAAYRRTGYPDEVLPSMDATLNFVPGRIPYPDVEQSLNSTNLASAISAQSSLGVDGTYAGRVWWDPVAPPTWTP
ncbi:MAG: SusD/RagB family nutrient-binding outer membrane lipoprotein [Gemmatimonadota bacterium]